VPPFATGKAPVTPVVSGKPVHEVSTPEVGVPRIGVINVGVLANTAAPEPVSSVSAAAKFALDGVVKNVATFEPRPDTPVAIGKFVQLLNTPEIGVPSAGATSVELVNNSVLVTCFVVPPWTIGKTSVVAAEVATGRAEIAMVAMLVVSCVNVKTLTG
jgi:hypothetical protein